MENGTTTGMTGIGFFDLLGIAFIVLKIAGVINWSWLWVLAPIWIPLVIAVIVVLIAIIIHNFF